MATTSTEEAAKKSEKAIAVALGTCPAWRGAPRDRRRRMWRRETFEVSMLAAVPRRRDAATAEISMSAVPRLRDAATAHFFTASKPHFTATELGETELAGEKSEKKLYFRPSKAGMSFRINRN